MNITRRTSSRPSSTKAVNYYEDPMEVDPVSPSSSSVRSSLLRLTSLFPLSDPSTRNFAGYPQSHVEGSFQGHEETQTAKQLEASRKCHSPKT